MYFIKFDRLWKKHTHNTQRGHLTKLQLVSSINAVSQGRYPFNIEEIKRIRGKNTNAMLHQVQDYTCTLETYKVSFLQTGQAHFASVKKEQATKDSCNLCLGILNFAQYHMN